METKIDFKASVIGYLKGTREKDFTLQQVDTKIGFIWTNCGSEESKSKADVYQKGSVCLPHFLAEEIETISNAKEYLFRQLASGEVSSVGISTEKCFKNYCPRVSETILSRIKGKNRSAVMLEAN